MKYDVFQLPDAHQKSLDDTPEPMKVSVILLDQDDLMLARGTAVLPLSLGVGVFWPDCPMPCSDQLGLAKCFKLPSGEIIRVKELTLCAGNPPHYDFWAC